MKLCYLVKILAVVQGNESENLSCLRVKWRFGRVVDDINLEN